MLWALVLCLVTLLFAAPTIACAGTAHADADTNTEPDCNQCHKPHVATVKRSLLDGASESEVCYVCHGNSGGSAWNVENGTANAFTLASGHVLEDSNDPAATVNLTNSCTSCHGAHGDPDLRANLPANEKVAGADIVRADPKTWCLACHNADQAWYAGTETAGVLTIDPTRKAYYEKSIQDPERLVANDYYPTLGTFPGGIDIYGATAYLSSTHAGIPAATVQSSVSATDTADRVAGDCLWCHASHRSAAPYDALLADYRPSTPDDVFGGANPGGYAQACFECHGHSSDTVYLEGDGDTDLDPLKGAFATSNEYWLDKGAADIYTLVTADNERAGHRIKSSSDGYYTIGSPLPCYECHNPHGSKNGNTTMISDALGGNLDPKSTDGEKVRQFCFSCHTTGDTGEGWDWDGTILDPTPGYTANLADTAIGDTVAGLPRTGAEPLQLKDMAGHKKADTDACTGCHGSTHKPTGGVSPGGMACYGCHSAYESPMEYDGLTRRSVYHHVLGVSSTSGDTAFKSGNYPGTGTTPLTDTAVYCLSCHVDHDRFYDGDAVDIRGSNLRSSIFSETAANSDYNTTSGGVCLGCHGVIRLKDVNNQLSSANTSGADSSTYTPAIDPAAYGRSAHGVKADGTTLYEVVSAPFGTSTTFQANCSKCHTDNRTEQFYDDASTAPTFGLHWGPARRILAALGRSDAASDPYAEERFCYTCHSPGGSPYKVAGNSGKDWYGTSGVSVSASAEGVYTQFTNNNVVRRSHRVSNTWTGTHRPAWQDETGNVSGVTKFTAAEHVECTDCHSPHAAGKVAVSGTKRANPATLTSNTINLTTSPLSGVWGVSYNAAAEWNEPTYSVQTTATLEYQLCLKCHSGFNSSYTPDGAANRSSGTFSWSSASASGARWTNVALEFNPANDSYHPVFAKAKRPITQAMNAPWNTNRGNQTMYCSDCHMDSAASPIAMGPHGSATTRILRGNWNPTSTATGYTLGSLDANFLCSKCHVLPGTNVVHARAAHQSYACGVCHIAIPHGGAAPRLLATTAGTKPTPAPYNVGTQLVTVNIPLTGSGRNNASCQVTTSPINCGVHSGAQPLYWNW